MEQAVKEKKDIVVWFGHSSYLLVIDGKTVLVDPVLYSGSPVSFINRPFKGTSIYKPGNLPYINYLVITHDHYDHLDYKAVKKLKHKTGKVIMPLGVGSHLEYWGYEPDKLVELDWMESFHDEVSFTCTPAKHFSGRSFKRNKTLWASFILQVGDKCIFIGGDGGYGNHFKKIGEEFDIDLAFIENGQYSGRWAQIHTMPEELHKVMEDLDAKHYITVHHSKFALSQHDWWEPRENEKYASEESGKDLIVLGGSQGGAQTIFAAANDPHVTLAAAGALLGAVEAATIARHKRRAAFDADFLYHFTALLAARRRRFANRCWRFTAQSIHRCALM